MEFSTRTARLDFVAELERRFQEGVATRAAAADEAAALPPENWQDIVDSGYLRAFHPKEIGGLGVDSTTQVMAMEALARACPGTYWSATMSTLLCGKLISTYGDTTEHRRLLDPILGGERIGCFAVVERTSGSDPGTYRTTVRPDGGGGYLITGEKARITNAPVADLAVTLARLEDPDLEDNPGWCFAFVDLRQEGVRTYPMPNAGLRAMPWGGVVFEDAPVAAADVVPVPFSEFAEGMAWGWLFISVASIAIAENALAEAVDHAGKQIVNGRPLGHLQEIQAMLADMRTEIDAARLLAWRASWERGRGRSARELIAMLKAYATEMAVRVVRQSVQIHGSWGLTRGRPVERYHRDAPMNVIGGFTSNRMREVVAEGMGLDASTHDPFDWLAPAGLGLDPVPGPLTSAPVTSSAAAR